MCRVYRRCVLPVPHTRTTQKTAHTPPLCCTSPLQPLPFPPLLPHLWTSDQPGYQRASTGAVWPKHTHTHRHFIHPYTQSTCQTMSLSNRVSNGVNANPWYHELPVWAVFPWKQSPTDQQRRRSRISETSDALFPNTQPELFHIQTTCKKLHKNLKKKLHLHWKLKQNKIISLSTFRISGLFFPVSAGCVCAIVFNF